jgi:hypothetical protein
LELKLAVNTHFLIEFIHNGESPDCVLNKKEGKKPYTTFRATVRSKWLQDGVGDFKTVNPFLLAIMNAAFIHFYGRTNKTGLEN